MDILYQSTRGAVKDVPASLAVLQGLAPDGGLFVPQSIPPLTESFEELSKCSYREVAYKVMSKYLSDYTEDELKYCIDNAYDDKFDTDEIAPLHKTENACFLELFHGKTIAFKDMALSILPHLMTVAAKKNDLKEEIVILTATSGDTGKAAMAGFADVPGTRIIVFYPKDGVSPVQERQMVTQKGDNASVIAIKGNFDDAQSGVKKMFADEALKQELIQAGFRFSSANSINIGRLVPQVVYYVYAYAQMIKKGWIKAGDKVNFVVPTGNFGNILAAYYAKCMGLPVNKLICASNKNKVLFDFFESGTYDKNREFFLTSSPSMDILISSNLERLVFKAVGEDPEKTAELMKLLNTGGIYSLTSDQRLQLGDFAAGYATDEEGATAIGRLYKNEGYVIDTHTAIADAVYEKYLKKTGDTTPTVIVSTASPYKFGRSVLAAVDPVYNAHTDMEQFDDLHKISGIPVPAAIEEIKTAPVRHDTTVEADEMKTAVRDKLGL